MTRTHLAHRLAALEAVRPGAPALPAWPLPPAAWWAELYGLIMASAYRDTLMQALGLAPDAAHVLVGLVTEET